MKTITSVLRRIDGRGYKAYRELQGAVEHVEGVTVRVVRVQSDPYAPPSVVRLETLLPRELEPFLRYPLPLADYLLRQLHPLLRRASRKRGEGHSGLLRVPKPSPIIINRSCIEIHGRKLIVRLWAGLPSRRRRVLAHEAEEMLVEVLPRVLHEAFANCVSSRDRLEKHVATWRAQRYLRGVLPKLGLVAFIADGSILPRKCGGCHEPLPGATPFESPPSMRVELELPWGETVTGMGVPKGFTVIAGSAFQGKSTLLEALAAGVWDHVPGDGREGVVTIRDAMYVRAEDGRYVSCVDISSFIHNLSTDTRCFTTWDASGATSVAAAIQEAVEAGAKLILVDEDSAATNILYLDEEASRITSIHTVTPITRLARSLTREGVSVVVASSGSKPLFAVADKVVVMEAYRPREATEEARRLSMGVQVEAADYYKPRPRRVTRYPRLRKPRIRARQLVARNLDTPIPLYYDIHLVEDTQYNTLQLVAGMPELFEGKNISDAARHVEELTSRMGGFAELVGGEPGPGLGEVRALDVAYMVNRIPGLKASGVKP